MPGNQLKVLISAPSIPPMHAGAGRRAYRQAKTLAEMGLRVSMMTATPGAASDGKLRIWRLPRMPGIRRGATGKLLNIVHLLRTFLSSALYMLLDRPDVVHVMSCFKWSQAIMLAAYCLRIPFVAETTFLEGDSLLVVRGSRLGWLSYKLVTRARMIVNISPGLRDAALATGLHPSRQRLIPNDVDHTLFSPPTSVAEKADLRAMLGLSKSSLYIICVAGWRPHKGIHRVIDVFWRSAGGDPDIVLVLCGPKSEGDHRKYEGKKNYANYINDMIIERGLGTRVISTGYVSDVHLWMRASDIFVHAAAAEGFGNVIIEAMSTELPIAVMAIPGITDFIVSDGVDGFVAPSVEGLADRVYALCNDVELRSRIGDRGRQSAIHRFGTDVVMKHYVELYRNCL